jgi:hypothetical protein
MSRKPPLIVVTAGQPGPRRASVAFAYDEGALAVIRSVPSRRWHRDERVWSIARDFVELAAGEFVQAGFEVRIDGRSFKAPTRRTRGDAGANPFVTLMNDLPPRLRERPSGPWTKVVHPDAGGDTDVMKLLNEAMRPARPGQ